MFNIPILLLLLKLTIETIQAIEVSFSDADGETKKKEVMEAVELALKTGGTYVGIDENSRTILLSFLPGLIDSLVSLLNHSGILKKKAKDSEPPSEPDQAPEKKQNDFWSFMGDVFSAPF